MNEYNVVILCGSLFAIVSYIIVWSQEKEAQKQYVKSKNGLAHTNIRLELALKNKYGDKEFEEKAKEKGLSGVTSVEKRSDILRQISKKLRRNYYE